MGNYVDRSGHRQSDFHDRNAATVDGFRSEHRVIRRRHANGGNNANLLDAAAHHVLVHGFGSFRDRFTSAGYDASEDSSNLPAIVTCGPLESDRTDHSPRDLPP